MPSSQVMKIRSTEESTVYNSKITVFNFWIDLKKKKIVKNNEFLLEGLILGHHISSFFCFVLKEEHRTFFYLKTKTKDNLYDLLILLL